MIKTYLSLVIFLLLITPSVSAQLSISVAGKIHKIPKFNKTVSSPRDSFTLRLDSVYMSYHILEPLSSSPYPFEVRCSSSGMTTNEYQIRVLKADKDSLWWELYTMYRTAGRASGATRYIEIGKGRGSLPVFLSIFVKRNSIAIGSYSVIDSLIHLGLFSEPSMNAILINLKEKNVKLQDPTLMDCCADMLFNIKVNNNYRRFIYNGAIVENNPNVKELADASKLVNMFLYIASDR
jgi:hypothetical protein